MPSDPAWMPDNSHMIEVYDHEFARHGSRNEANRAVARLAVDSFIAHAARGVDVERVLDNMATASQDRNLLRDSDSEETELREAVRINLEAAIAQAVAAERERIVAWLEDDCALRIDPPEDAQGIKVAAMLLREGADHD